MARKAKATAQTNESKNENQSNAQKNRGEKRGSSAMRNDGRTQIQQASEVGRPDSDATFGRTAGRGSATDVEAAAGRHAGD